MLRRTHTAFAVACIALVPLVPAGMWANTRLSSVDRAAAVAAAEAVLASAPPPPGARPFGRQAVYERRAWDGGDSLTPIAGYSVDTAYRLASAMTPRALVEHYRRALAGWTVTVEPFDCRTLSLAPGCGALTATFRRDGTKLSLDAAEYMVDPARPRLRGMLRSFGVYVSQNP